MTNVLVEGGSHLLGALFDGQLVDGQLVDELHVFIAPKVVGGETAISPVGGFGQVSIPDRSQLEATHVETIGEDIYIRGRLRRDGPKVTETDQSRS
jgi:diaminohydroxyphosphoribosylaminopyrimidine deaminase/5-amino-6-(5-phosphoribosylamino)uracil reductase